MTNTSLDISGRIDGESPRDVFGRRRPQGHHNEGIQTQARSRRRIRLERAIELRPERFLDSNTYAIIGLREPAGVAELAEARGSHEKKEILQNNRAGLLGGFPSG